MKAPRAFLLLSLVLFVLAGNLSAATITYSDSLTGGPVWNRPNFGSPPDSVVYYWFYYHTFAFSVTQTGNYNLETTYQDFDGALFLYQNSFDPNSPLANVLYGNDDSGPGLQAAIYNVPLSSGVNYYLITSSFGSYATGSFTNQISGVGDIMGPVNGVPEPSTLFLGLTGLALVFTCRRALKHRH